MPSASDDQPSSNSLSPDDRETSKPWLMVATVAIAAFAGGIVTGRALYRHDTPAASVTTVGTTVPAATVPANALDLDCQSDWMPDANSGWDVSWPVQQLTMSFGDQVVWRVTAQTGRESTFAVQGSLGAFGLAAGYTIEGSRPTVAVAGQTVTLAIAGDGHQASVACL